jgi:hypothetical protein
MANAIKEAAKLIVFDDLQEWNVGTYDPVANYSVGKKIIHLALVVILFTLPSITGILVMEIIQMK